MEAIAQLRRDQPRIVVVKAADGDRGIQQDAVVCDVDGVDGEFPAFAEGVAGGDVEGGVDGQIRALVGALRASLQPIGEAGAVVDIGGEPGVLGQVCREAGVQRLALVVIDGRVVESEVAGRVSLECCR